MKADYKSASIDATPNQSQQPDRSAFAASVKRHVIQHYGKSLVILSQSAGSNPIASLFRMFAGICG